MIIQLNYSSSGSGWLEPLPGGKDTKQAPTLDRTLCRHRATHMHIHTYSDWDHFRHTNSPDVCSFGMWEETGIPGESPHRREEKVPTPHRQWPQLRIIFCHLCYNKTFEWDVIWGSAIVTYDSVEALVLRDQVNTSKSVIGHIFLYIPVMIYLYCLSYALSKLNYYLNWI